MNRLGFIHIPGSAGTSLGFALAKSMNTSYFPTHRVRKFGESSEFNPLTLDLPAVENDLAHQMLLSYPLFCGHLSIGEMQSLYRSCIFTQIGDPRLRLIRLFRHHAKKDASFPEWLGKTVSYRSPILTQLLHGIEIPQSGKWEDLHSLGRSNIFDPVGSTASSFFDLVSQILDYAFLTDNPQFCLDILYRDGIIPQHVIVPHANRVKEIKYFDWGSIDQTMELLQLVTQNDYQVINFLQNFKPLHCNLVMSTDKEIENLLYDLILAGKDL